MSNPLEDTTQETLEAITKAQTTGITTATGVVSYDLTGIVNLIPVVTPLRDKIARDIIALEKFVAMKRYFASEDGEKEKGDD